MSANGATKRDLFRVIREKDVLISELYERIWELEKQKATSPALTGLAALTAGAENGPLHNAEVNSAPRI